VQLFFLRKQEGRWPLLEFIKQKYKATTNTDQKRKGQKKEQRKFRASKPQILNLLYTTNDLKY